MVWNCPPARNPQSLLRETGEDDDSRGDAEALRNERRRSSVSLLLSAIMIENKTLRPCASARE